MDNHHTLEAKKIAAREILALLESIPPAQGPNAGYYTLVRDISVLEKTIKRLKSFVSFLSKLNPLEYLRWMHEAFSGYVASKKPSISSDNEIYEPSETLSEKPKSKKTKHKEYNKSLPHPRI